MCCPLKTSLHTCGAHANTCVCTEKNGKFKHATRILEVIMLQYSVKVRPMPGMWIQSIPVTTIQWGGMNIGRRGALPSKRQD